MIAIDPGSERSAVVIQRYGWHGWQAPEDTEKGGLVQNDRVLEILGDSFQTVAIEWIQHMGMPAGASLFDTARWVGRFEQLAKEGGERVVLIPRGEIKLELCGSARAKDSNVRQALLDLYGGKEAVGTKKRPGPLYGIRGHGWQALAVGVVAQRRLRRGAA